ncbi:MAG: hypothetical protein KAR20_22910 [Candidatus Heimdallarchaeota archaeon]|nr:hypothetical protein [Candidatus Heimdallarchaeota archaeon]
MSTAMAMILGILGGILLGLTFSLFRWISPLIIERNDALAEIRFLEADIKDTDILTKRMRSELNKLREESDD